tara:strand:+ start:755 stop:1552 length:798 start_codon:yes stop_codon:yes gene_type:complete
MDTLSDLCSIEDNLFQEIFSSDRRASSREFAIRSSVEGVVKDLVDMVEEENLHYEPTIGQSVVRALFVDDDPSPRELFDFVDSRRDSRYCSCCGQHEWSILERIRKENGDPGDLLEEHDEGLVCLSCSEMLALPGAPTNISQAFDEGFPWKCCSNCFLSERMGLRYGIDIEVVSSWPVERVCSVCLDIFPDLGIQEYDTEEEETYEGEYENEELPENNGEIQKEIKGSIQDMGSLLFDIRDKVSEGEFLKLMNLFQEVTNNVNRL